MNCDRCIHQRTCRHIEMYKIFQDMILKINQTEPKMFEFPQPRCIYFEDPQLGVKENK